jgi:diguanylate cyclase
MQRCFEDLCATMDRLGVPRESKWRGLILYMRSIKDYDFLTEEQREKTQQLVMEALKKKDFSDKAFNDLLFNNERILNDQWRAKLTGVLHDTAVLIKQFQELVQRRKEDVHDLGEKTLETVQSELPVNAMITKIASGFEKIEGLLQNDLEAIVSMGMTDVLTKLNNRRSFDYCLEKFVSEALEAGTPLAMIFLDIDHFKQFNDTYGHLVGDQALVTVGALINSFEEHLKNDSGRELFSARYGGEEFVILLPGIGGDEALAMAEKLRSKVADYNFLIRDANGAVLVSGVKITISAGVAELHADCPHNPSAAALVAAADQGMYTAKGTGRNRVQRGTCSAARCFPT